MTTGFQATDRSLLRVSGTDSAKFLQDLISNNLPSQGLACAALLTPQGKYLADFLIHTERDAYVLDVPAELASALGQRLAMYKLRADVSISADPRPVWVLLDGHEGFEDPRHPALGRRVYGDPERVDVVPPDQAEALRILHVVPKAGAELIANDSYILECGFERVNGVDFRKGCYVGQEVTARMKHKTTLRKGIAGVRFGEDGVEQGAEIICAGKSCGTVTSVAGRLGIAYLRFDRAGPEMMADGVSVNLREPGEA